MNLCKLYLPALLLTVTLFASCKEEENALEYKSQGFIKGTLSTTLSDDETPFNDSFRYTEYKITEYEYPFFYKEDDGSLTFSMNRYDMTLGSEAYWEFHLDNEGDTTPDETSLYMSHYKISSTKIISLEFYQDDFAISDFSFDPATGRAQGTFSFTAISNSSSSNDVFVEGSFDVIVKRSYYR